MSEKEEMIDIIYNSRLSKNKQEKVIEYIESLEKQLQKEKEESSIKLQEIAGRKEIQHLSEIRAYVAGMMNSPVMNLSGINHDHLISINTILDKLDRR